LCGGWARVGGLLGVEYFRNAFWKAGVDEFENGPGTSEARKLDLMNIDELLGVEPFPVFDFFVFCVHFNRKIIKSLV